MRRTTRADRSSRVSLSRWVFLVFVFFFLIRPFWLPSAIREFPVGAEGHGKRGTVPVRDCQARAA
jgi:hypothetical protein